MTESNRVWIRLADEGIPVAAIARSFGARFSEVHALLKEARDRGEIAEVPPSDWKAGAGRQSRAEEGGASPYRRAISRLDHNDPIAIGRAIECFRLTRQEAQVLLLIASRTAPLGVEAISRLLFKDGDTRDPERARCHIATLIAKVRAKFLAGPYRIEIKTIHGIGYTIGEGGRGLVLKTIFPAEPEGIT